MNSQNAEEQIILDYFKGQTGTFCDLGSNDGITFSNTYALSKLGWCGVLVEPSPRAHAKLKQLYKETKGCFYLYDYAILDINGSLTLHESGELVKTGDVGLVSTFIEKETERFRRTVKYDDVTVNCYRWKTAMNKWKFKKFDFISLDIEGAELDWIDETGKKRDGVLKQIDVTDTQLICIETNGDLVKKAQIDEILTGFKVIYTSPENLIYAR